MYIGEPFSWKPAAFEGSNGIMSVTTEETTAHGRVVYINEANRYFTANLIRTMLHNMNVEAVLTNLATDGEGNKKRDD